MKILVSIVCLLFVFNCKQDSPYKNEIEKFRAEQNKKFLDPATSPFNEEELKTFHGFLYFEIDEKYRVNAVFKRIPDLPFFDMPHTNNATRSYQKFGDVEFRLKGKKYSLPVYSNENFKKDHELFFPFHDLTNGKETYGGGRFLDLKYSDTSSVVEVDFNLCYHPYCARSHRFHCPIVPKENNIDMEVKAGEKL
ncbi:MAG: DUF1684 domain-containing protein [Bacteroidia bacterium]